MYFANAAVLAALASLASATTTNTVRFESQDDVAREIVFTPPAGADGTLSSAFIEGEETKTITFPTGWVGNWFARPQGETYSNGMLGEVTFQGWDGITYFDVSAITNSSDTGNVKQLYPVSEAASRVKSLVSGCLEFPCDTVYIHPDDTQTVSTKLTEFVCTLGNPSSSSKRDFVERDDDAAVLVPHHYVMGKLS